MVGSLVDAADGETVFTVPRRAVLGWHVDEDVDADATSPWRVVLRG